MSTLVYNDRVFPGILSLSMWRVKNPGYLLLQRSASSLALLTPPNLYLHRARCGTIRGETARRVGGRRAEVEERASSSKCARRRASSSSSGRARTLVASCIRADSAGLSERGLWLKFGGAKAGATDYAPKVRGEWKLPGKSKTPGRNRPEGWSVGSRG